LDSANVRNISLALRNSYLQENLALSTEIAVEEKSGGIRDEFFDRKYEAQYLAGEFGEVSKTRRDERPVIGIIGDDRLVAQQSVLLDATTFDVEEA
jgi:hypothetical protein